MSSKIFYTCLLVIWLLLLETGYSSDFRILSLGNCRLALLDEDNDLNLYDAVGNPAYLLFDETRDWLKLYGGGNYYSTSLKRLYDPSKAQNLLFNVEGIKKLSQRHTVWGKVNYTFNNQNNIYQAIEPDPYADDPLVLTDSTAGDFSQAGPSIHAVYHYQPFQKFGFGLEFKYDISTSMKKEYTRPRTIHRNFEGKVALTYKLTSQFTLGSFINMVFLQDQIELEKSWDGKDIHTLRYRSELVFREKVGVFDRYINVNGLNLNIALQHQSSSERFHNLLIFDYYQNKQKVADQTGTVRTDDSFWYQNYMSFSYLGRLIYRQAVFGLKANYMKGEDWSEHPTLPILITERDRDIIEVSAGASYQFSKILLVTEGGVARMNEHYQDYQSFLDREGTNTFYIGKLGMEYQFDPIHHIMIGYNYNYYNPNFLSPLYLPEHSGQYFSIGLSESRARYEINLHLHYLLKNAVDSLNSFDGWNVMIFTKIYMN